MQIRAAALIYILIAMLFPGLPAEAVPAGSQTPTTGQWADADQGDPKKKDKKKKKKKKRKKKKKAEKKKPAKAPEWTFSDSPMGHYLWLVRQLPDFSEFPRATEKITLSAVAKRKKDLMFLESCEAKKTKHGWKVSGCKAIKVDDDSFLSRLVSRGADTSASAESSAGLTKLSKQVSKAKKVKDLHPLMLKTGLKNPKGYKSTDDLDEDLKSCGSSRYRKALRSYPRARYVGPNVVVIDLEYVVEKGGKSYRVKSTMAKTKDGWKLGGFRVKCY